MMKTPLTRLIIASFFMLSTSALAVEYQSPRTLALGGAGRAGPLLNDSIYLNPSFASFTPIYSASGGYTWFNTGRNYNVSVQDARDPLVQAGIGYTRREQNGAVNIGASRQIVKQLGFGLGPKFIIDDHTSKVTSDFIFSTSFLATKWMYASIIVDNVMQSDAALQRNLFRTLFVAFKFIPTKEVEFYIDPLYSPDYTAGKKAGFSAGVELGILADFYLRAGKFVDAEVSYLDTRGSGFGLGIGWIGPRINFDYAMNRVVTADNGDSLITAQSFAMTIFF
jgi:hypothetical protein